MTEQDFMREWCALTNAPDTFSNLEAWREYRDSAARLVTELDSRLRAADEAELARAQAKAAEIQKRLGMRPAERDFRNMGIQRGEWTEPTPKPHNPVMETDWGNGVGGREKPIDPTNFRNELADLRDRTTEKRARRGVS